MLSSGATYPHDPVTPRLCVQLDFLGFENKLLPVLHTATQRSS